MPWCPSVQGHVTSCTATGCWCCSSGDEREKREAWRLSPQPKSVPWVLTGWLCAGERAIYGLRPRTLYATTVPQEIHGVSGMDLNPTLLAG